MYQFNLTPYEFDMSHQESTTKNAVLHKTAKMELSAFAPELYNYTVAIIRSIKIFLNPLILHENINVMDIDNNYLSHDTDQ